MGSVSPPRGIVSLNFRAASSQRNPQDRAAGSCSLGCSPRSLSTYSHVGFASCVHGFSNRVDEVTANAKIAHFHLPLRIDQHVRGLYICKKEHRPQSLSRGGGWAKPQAATEEHSISRAQQSPAEPKPRWLRLWHAQVTASWACHVSCHCPFTHTLPSLVQGSRR